MTKTLKLGLAALLLACGVFAGCSLFTGTTAQRTEYNTIFSVEQTASLTVDGYYALVIKGVVPTNDVPQVSHLFSDIQAAGTLAAAGSQNGTNALAPASLTAELSSLTTLITTITTK